MSSKDIKINVSTPGKVILHGEHSVVYGKLAIAASLGLRTKLQLEETTSSTSSSSSSSSSSTPHRLTLNLKALNYKHDFNLQTVIQQLLETTSEYSLNASEFNFRNPEQANHELILDLVEKFLRENVDAETLGHSQKSAALTSLFYLFTGVFASVNFPLDASLTLTVETELNISAGTGSSASYLVSVAAAFVQYVRLKSAKLGLGNVSKEKYLATSVDASSNLTKCDESILEIVSKWAQNAERIIHGQVSGIDNTICTYGSMVEFRKGTAPKIVKISRNFTVLLVNTKVPRNTKTLVAKVAELKQKYPEIVESLLDALEGIAKRAVDIFASDDDDDASGDSQELYENISDLMELNHNVLRTLGVSHSTLEDICDKIRTSGLRGKLTGAGGGGYAIAIVPPYYKKKVIEELCRNLESVGYEAVLTGLGGPGVTIECS